MSDTKGRDVINAVLVVVRRYDTIARQCVVRSGCMNEARQTQCNLPGWLSEALREGYLTGDLPNKRSESRRVWTFLCLLTSEDDPSSAPITVRVSNVSSGGIGFISRKVLIPNSRFKLTPEGREDAEPVHVRIVHCTQTVQGYKVGCSIESA